MYNDTNRIISLDWLRGLCAITIMFYHYLFMNKDGNFLFDTFGKLGVYGVSTFFVLSGLSMAIVYNSKIKTSRDTLSFFSKRIFRILPLYALVCILTILLNKSNYSLTDIILNITTLFGFISPSSYIPMGGWSIGNEMVYYLLTPGILYLYDKKKSYGNIVFVVSLLIGLYFSFYIVDVQRTVSENWHLYVNPFNNLFFFTSGIFIYYNFRDKTYSNKLLIIIFIVASSMFVLLPYHGNSDSSLIAGPFRIVYFLIILTWVVCVYKFNVSQVGPIGKTFEKFGIATYGVYLLHPIVMGFIFKSLKVVNIHVPKALILSVSIVSTVLIALLSYYYFEIKISNWGKTIIKKYISK